MAETKATTDRQTSPQSIKLALRPILKCWDSSLQPGDHRWGIFRHGRPNKHQIHCYNSQGCELCLAGSQVHLVTSLDSHLEIQVHLSRSRFAWFISHQALKPSTGNLLGPQCETVDWIVETLQLPPPVARIIIGQYCGNFVLTVDRFRKWFVSLQSSPFWYGSYISKLHCSKTEDGTEVLNVDFEEILDPF